MESFLYVYIVLRDIRYMRNIREYYMENYPSDELGAEINPEATFTGLYTVLRISGEVYEYIGVGDSLIRERCFERLAEIAGVSYDEIYSKWVIAP